MFDDMKSNSYKFDDMKSNSTMFDCMKSKVLKTGLWYIQNTCMYLVDGYTLVEGKFPFGNDRLGKQLLSCR
jgi:hypothetical protein